MKRTKEETKINASVVLRIIFFHLCIAFSSFFLGFNLQHRENAMEHEWWKKRHKDTTNHTFGLTARSLYYLHQVKVKRKKGKLNARLVSSSFCYTASFLFLLFPSLSIVIKKSWTIENKGNVCRRQVCWNRMPLF